MQLMIDEEFKNIIPPLTGSEFEQLEKNLLNEGCRERIITWEGYIIDGHNRYNVCKKHGLDYEVLELDHFRDRHEVIDWMIHNQIGKRNLSGGTISYLRGLKLKREKERKIAELESKSFLQEPTELPDAAEVQADAVATGEESTEQNSDAPEKEAPAAKKDVPKDIKKEVETLTEEVAGMYRVSPSTLKKDEKFTIALDTIRDNAGKEIQDKILNKEIKLNAAEVVNIAKMESDQQKDLMSGPDEVILEKLAEVKKRKQLLNQERAVLKLEQRLSDLNDLDDNGVYELESDEESVTLIRRDIEQDAGEELVSFKSAAKLDGYLDGFIDAAKLFLS